MVIICLSKCKASATVFHRVDRNLLGLVEKEIRGGSSSTFICSVLAPPRECLHWVSHDWSYRRAIIVFISIPATGTKELVSTNHVFLD